MTSPTSTDHRAGPLKKHDLQFTYSQGSAAGDDPAKGNEPDYPPLVLLNRDDWYAMLCFVNEFANTCGEGRRDVALKAEWLIKEKLPDNLRSHQTIQNWLSKNWTLYIRV